MDMAMELGASKRLILSKMVNHIVAEQSRKKNHSERLFGMHFILICFKIFSFELAMLLYKDFSRLSCAKMLVSSSMTRLKLVTLGAFTVLTTGCISDQAYGPVLRNDLGKDVIVAVYYSDGSVSHNRWFMCDATFMGKRDATIRRLIISSSGNVLYDLNSDKVRELLLKESNISVFHIWNVSTGGITFEYGSAAKKCVP